MRYYCLAWDTIADIRSDITVLLGTFIFSKRKTATIIICSTKVLNCNSSNKCMPTGRGGATLSPTWNWIVQQQSKPSTAYLFSAAILLLTKNLIAFQSLDRRAFSATRHFVHDLLSGTLPMTIFCFRCLSTAAFSSAVQGSSFFRCFAERNTHTKKKFTT